MASGPPAENSPPNWIDPLGMEQNKDKCPSVPFHLDSKDIDKNIAEAESDGPLLYNVFGAPLMIDDYYHKSRGRGPRDYQQEWTMKEFGSVGLKARLEE